MGTPIPGPPGLPLLGNLRDIDPSNFVGTEIHLSSIYGPIFRLNLPGQARRVFLCSQELMDEACDEKRFVKSTNSSLDQVRNGIGDGLFTAYHGEENWALAHRILMPAFGPLATKHMFEEMYDVACQLVSKWARYGPEHKIHITDDFTRLTLDSIALCAMDTRFNSFYREGLHPFVEAMQFFLKESGARGSRPEFVNNTLYRQSTKQYWESIEVMKSVAKEVIKERRGNPSDKKDLVNAMLLGTDPKTGKKLPDENIMNNMITFLIAGHETTSGLLSFLFTLYLKTPHALKAAQREVDEVIGAGPVLYEHMGKLPYISASIREALRLYPTAPGFSVKAISNDPSDYPVYIGKDRYEIHHGDVLVVALPVALRDPAVYGEDAAEFKPERMLDENFNKLPRNSWKPFGNGARACIGRGFAIQEAHIAIALLLQNFNFRADDPSYKIEIVQTLTIKPKNFYMYAALRNHMDPVDLERKLWNGTNANVASVKDQKVEELAIGAPKKAISIFYGSNTGTSESLAQTLANAASSRGYVPVVRTMDAGTDNVPKDQPVVIITASYEGEPPDNAAHFYEWLSGLKGKELEGVKHAVFGCGHRDWQNTFQKIPKQTDNLLAERGSVRLVERGVSDAADNDIFNDFDKWADHVFWPGIEKVYGIEKADPAPQGLDIEIITHSRSSDLRQDVREAIVKDARVLTAEGEPEKRHIELQLPTDMSYQAGDYLAVLPINHDKHVKAIMTRFSIPWDSRIIVKEGQNTVLPTGKDVMVYELLASYVELNQPATQKNVAAISLSIPDEAEREKVEALTATEISSKRISVLHLLEQHPTATLPFGAYLSMLPPMRIRQYSISSSPLASPTTCTLTYAVLNQTAKAGGSKRFLGTASNYLSELSAGDRIRVAVRPSHAAFHLPLDVANVPVMMACAGTGLAPFRAFAQERARQLASGRALAPALLFVGCRGPGRDVLYADEMAGWAAAGAVGLRYAFSGAPDLSEGCRYVQDRMWHDREECRALWRAGARIFVCGDGRVGEGVREALIRSYVEKGMGSAEEARTWFDGIRNERFASDVFA